MENEKTWQIKVMIEQLGSLRGMLKSHEEQMQQLREDNNWLKENYLPEKTLPQPCRKFKDASTKDFIVKLSEEVAEVVQEALRWEALRKVNALQTSGAKRRLAEELTDVITVCTTWLDAQGYNTQRRGEVQEVINAKNKARGYW